MFEAAVADLHARIRACTHCAEHLPLGPRPIVQFSAISSIVITGQSPGRRGHESGLTFDGPSGARISGCLGLDREAFYDASRIAMLPVGFCYPGTGKSGGLPPRLECAPLWHHEVVAQLP
jgi:uracil-DNA glycosylase